MALSVFIPGLPVPKQSFRVGKAGGWQPARVKQYQKRTHFAAAAAMRKQGWRRVTAGRPVRVRAVFVYPLPKSTRKADRGGWFHRTARPDCDNLIKGTLDALSAAGVWDDDQQVAELHISKANGPRGEEGVLLIVEEIDDPYFRFQEDDGREPGGLPVEVGGRRPDEPGQDPDAEGLP